MNSQALLVVVNPSDQHKSTGYDTWTLARLLQYNRDKLDAGALQLWVPIEATKHAGSSRHFVEARLARLRG